MEPAGRVVVAGHLCLDIVPEMRGATESTSTQMFQGGQLTQIGPVTLSPGGVVANTGQALRLLGIDALLMGKVGGDRFGTLVGELLQSSSASPEAVARLPGSTALKVDPSVSTSYTLVLTPPDIDRVYFHCSGANDTFSADDIDPALVSESSLFHFGYPPLMSLMFKGAGEELARVFRLARQQGVVTSLDMAMADPGAPAGQAPWRTILENTLPFVDVFLPSAEETVRMLHPEWESATNVAGNAQSRGAYAGYTIDQLSELSGELARMGCSVVVFKLGSDGIYVRTAMGDAQRRGQLPPLLQAVGQEFGARELISPCYSANVVSAVGAGDATVAGFLAGLVRELPLADCANIALGVGAKSVEDLHSTGGIPGWQPIVDQIASGWPKNPGPGGAGSAGGPSSASPPSPEWRYVDSADLFERE